MNIDGTRSYAAATSTLGITIADQLAAAGRSWKTYQEKSPNDGRGFGELQRRHFTNNTDFSQINPQLTPPLSTANIVRSMRKHNPFVYFQSVQQARILSPAREYDWLRRDARLWSDLGSEESRLFSHLPNQCNDQHGRATALPSATLIQPPTAHSRLNPALIILGDQVVQKIVTRFMLQSVEGRS